VNESRGPDTPSDPLRQMLAVNLQGTFTQLLMLSDTQFIENVATPLFPAAASPL